ncbi:MurR/RpiR family transcriptional regulator [Mycoplasmopsis alligatoris]|uniref:SIS domain protein n=1 Tax=Mycoplasmopsis alligatoris A21JP2 TaxID=747682 RepID=D4XVT1_9BACT|nr:MurR/RpiR family transcriptional regulator [Mycoplasmopsis alligatoris]EFF41545.1 SIS domain protein [Mycoplasmopsis alligatoris A21JP2]
MNSKYNIFSDDKFKELIRADDNYSYLANWIEQNPNAFLTKSQDQLSGEIFVSQASISRFVKKSGFNNYRELQVFVAMKAQEVIPTMELELKKGNKINDLKNNVFLQYSNLTKIVYNSIDENILENVVKDLLNSKIIFIMGIGTNGEISSYYARQFRKFGINAYAINSIHDFVEEIEGFVGQNIHCILLSKSFKTKEILNATLILLKKKINYSIITTNANLNYTGCKNILLYQYFDKRSYSFDIANKIALYMVLDIILLAMASVIDPEMETFKKTQSLLQIYK